MIGEWKTGLSWTPGHFEIKPLHDWSKKHAEPFYMSGTGDAEVPEFWTPWVAGGPFFHFKGFLGMEGYIGMRPTATDPPGVPLEPFPAFFFRFLKRHGLGNFGIALRRAHE